MVDYKEDDLRQHGKLGSSSRLAEAAQPMTMDFWEPLHVRVSEVTCGIQNDYKDPMHQEQGF